MAKKLKRYDVFDIVLIIFFLLFSFVMIFPIWYVIICSFNEGSDYIAGGIYLLPREFTLYNYYVVFSNEKLWHAYFITISRTVFGTAIALGFTSIVAYAMSRKELPFKKAIYVINIFTMFFNGGLIPFFLIIKMLGFYDTYWLYLIPCIFLRFCRNNQLIFDGKTLLNPTRCA